MARWTVRLLCPLQPVPLAEYINFGPALFVIEMWYLSVGLLRGAMRLWILFYFNIMISFFYPHKCIFPDGRESWDSAHVAFLCYVMERVEQDKRALRHDGRRLAKAKVFGASLSTNLGESSITAEGSSVGCTNPSTGQPRRPGGAKPRTLRRLLQSRPTGRISSIMPETSSLKSNSSWNRSVTELQPNTPAWARMQHSSRVLGGLHRPHHDLQEPDTPS